jgi:hypothetical protein
MRFAFIANYADMLPVERPCRIMDVSPRGKGLALAQDLVDLLEFAVLPPQRLELLTL